ncbi:MAG: PhoD-like phosphatase N-terminal domain-containing protein, partial [Chromatocurvus sp.]
MSSNATPGGHFSRRQLLRAGIGASALTGSLAPAFVRSAGGRGATPPDAGSGAQIGDLRGDSAVIWSRTDRDARMRVRWSTAADFSITGGEQHLHTLQDTDYTGKIRLSGLPAGKEIHYAVDFLDLGDYRSRSEPVTGSFRTPPADDRNVRFLWSGDNVGQGWGINPDIGGIPIYRRMAGLNPDFFIHSGDTIYADSPLSGTVALEDGKVWRNLVTEPKSRIAESLDDFRGQYRYNLLDAV